MSAFEYSRPESLSSQSLEGLSEAARNSLTQNVPGNNLVEQLVPPKPNRMEVTASHIQNWALAELHAEETVRQWQKYDPFIPNAPNGLYDLIDKSRNTVESLEYLYEVREALKASGEVTPDGINLGDSMHLVLIPWWDIGKNLDNFRGWAQSLRGAQTNNKIEDYFDAAILRGIEDDNLYYRGANHPDIIVSPRDYINAKISAYGNWGLMLAQTTPIGGTNKLLEKSPDELTKEGISHLEIAGYPLDAMGVFEWLSLTWQINPLHLSSDHRSLLLANRFTVNRFRTRTPIGYCSTPKVFTDYSSSSSILNNCTPRLAIIA